MAGFIFITHDVNEAVLLADRILVMGKNPGYIKKEFHIELARPRNQESHDFSICRTRIKEELEIKYPSYTRTFSEYF